MPAHNREPDKILSDRARISTLYLKGWTQYAIASELGITRELVRYDLGVIREDWLSSSIRNFDLAKEEQLAKIDLIEQEAWKAWEMSMAARETTVNRARRREIAIPGGEGEEARRIPIDQTSESSKQTTQKDPGEVYLARVAWCVEMRCKILGLIAAADQKQVSSATSVTEVSYELVQGNANARMVELGGEQPALSNGVHPPADAVEPPHDLD